MKTISPTKETAVKILELLNHGLCEGLGSPEPGKMCVEAAVCYAMGMPHSDNPSCVSKAVRSFKISLNDSCWSSDQARAKGLRRLAIAQLGSEKIDGSIFVKEITLAAIRLMIPIAFRAAAKLHPDKKHQDELLKHAGICEAADELAAASAAYAAASAASAAHPASAAYAACAASYAAASAASAASAAYAASAACAAAYAAAARDEVLSIMAEAGVQALIKCKSPGCEWLSLTEN